MSTTLILNLLLGLWVFNALMFARYTVTENRLLREMYGPGLMVFRLVASLAFMSLYVAFAIKTGYWQFAAGLGVTLLITVGSVAGRKVEVSS